MKCLLLHLYIGNVPRSLPFRQGRELPRGTAWPFLKQPSCPLSLWAASAVALKCLAGCSHLCNYSSCLPVLSTLSLPFSLFSPVHISSHGSVPDEMDSQAAKSSGRIVYILSCCHHGCFSFQSLIRSMRIFKSNQIIGVREEFFLLTTCQNTALHFNIWLNNRDLN